MKVLIVDDDLVLADVVSFTMRRAGFDVVLAYDGRAALEQWRAAQPDLIILDLKLPNMDGLTVCRTIRAETDLPIIMLSVRGEDDDVVRGLEMGADDYIAKPFSPSQLVARAKAVLRRSGVPFLPTRVTIGGLLLDPSRREVVYADGERATLTQLEYRLLETLAINVGQVIPADRLIDKVWGINGGDRVMLKQLIHRLRRKIEAEGMPPLIETVPGIGYALTPPPPDE
jgi:DNA-binding response OmpR family regulator